MPETPAKPRAPKGKAVMAFRLEGGEETLLPPGWTPFAVIWPVVYAWK